MRLFHVSEEKNIKEFIPRIPTRDDMDKTKGLVWALNERCLPNFLTPRDCPRVTYHSHEKTTQSDIEKYFSSSARHCVAIEYCWHKKMTETSLYIYEFEATNFYLQDECAGYYVSEQTEKPISVRKCDDLYKELFSLNIEVRILDYLWDLGRKVQKSSLHWSLCRMANAASEKMA
jgi:DNA repair exonuclease SbcCD nuclease subunit